MHVFKPQNASFSGRCGGCSAVGFDNVKRNNSPALLHEGQHNRTKTTVCPNFQPSAGIREPDCNIFDSEKLIIEVEKSSILYDKAIP